MSIGMGSIAEDYTDDWDEPCMPKIINDNDWYNEDFCEYCMGMACYNDDMEDDCLGE